MKRSGSMPPRSSIACAKARCRAMASGQKSKCNGSSVGSRRECARSTTTRRAEYAGLIDGRRDDSEIDHDDREREERDHETEQQRRKTMHRQLELRDLRHPPAPPFPHGDADEPGNDQEPQDESPHPPYASLSVKQQSRRYRRATQPIWEGRTSSFFGRV